MHEWKDVFLAKIFHSAPDLHAFGVKDENVQLILSRPSIAVYSLQARVVRAAAPPGRAQVPYSLVLSSRLYDSCSYRGAISIK